MCLSDTGRHSFWINIQFPAVIYFTKENREIENRCRFPVSVEVIIVKFTQRVSCHCFTECPSLAHVNAFFACPEARFHAMKKPVRHSHKACSVSRWRAYDSIGESFPLTAGDLCEAFKPRAFTFGNILLTSMDTLVKLTSAGYEYLFINQPKNV